MKIVRNKNFDTVFNIFILIVFLKGYPLFDGISAVIIELQLAPQLSF